MKYNEGVENLQKNTVNVNRNETHNTFNSFSSFSEIIEEEALLREKVEIRLRCQWNFRWDLPF